MKDLLISKLREMVKVKKPKVKKTEPTEADRADFAAWQDKKERDREPSDIEDERNQMAKHYGQQSEAIDFSKKTILGQAARPMAAQMLRKRKAELQREPELAKKGGAVARELKAFSKDTYRHKGDPKPEPQRSSTELRTQLAYVLADKLEELKLPQGGIERNKQGRAIRGERYKGAVAKAAFTAITGRQAPDKVNVKPGGEVDVGTPESRADLPKYPKGDPALKRAGRQFQKSGPKAGLKRPPKPKEPPKPENASTDLRTQLMYILADKLDEVNKPRLNVPDPTDRPKPEPVPTEPVKPPKPLAKYYRPKSKKPPITEELKAKIAYILANKIDEIILPSFKVDKEEVEARKTRGMKPFPTTQKPPPPSKEELMQVAAKAAKKHMPSITDVDVSQYLPKPPVKEWTERIIKILVEMKRPAHLKADKYKISGAAKLQGLPQINKLRADRGQRPHPRSPLANDPNMMKKSTALASVFSSQPLGPTEKAKVEADKAKEAADRPRVEAELAKFDRDPVVARIRRNNRRWSK